MAYSTPPNLFVLLPVQTLHLRPIWLASYSTAPDSSFEPTTYLFHRQFPVDATPLRPELGFCARTIGRNAGYAFDFGFPPPPPRSFVPPDWDPHDFLVGRRGSASESIEFSRARPGDSEGLEVIEIEPYSYSDEQIVANGNERESLEALDRMREEEVVRFCWDCNQSSRRIRNEDHEWGEWEEVGRAHNDESELDREQDGAAEDTDVNNEREVLRLVNSLGRNPMDSDNVDACFVDDDHEGVADEYEPYEEVLPGQFADYEADSDNVEACFFDDNHEGVADEYESYKEVLPGQFADYESDSDNVETCFLDDDHEDVADEYEYYKEVLPRQFADYEAAFCSGNPRMAYSVVPSVFLPQEERITEHDMNYAVYDEGILVGERPERLPSAHHDHEERIVLPLEIRNRCSSCGLELPMDDFEFEQGAEGW